MTNGNNKNLSNLDAQELQKALFDMRDSLMTLSLELKDYLFEAQAVKKNLEECIQKQSLDSNEGSVIQVENKRF